MKRQWLGAVLALGLAVGCAHTSMTNSWKNPQFSGQLPKKTLVIALVPTESTRHQIEELEAAKLRSMGTDATPSYTIAQTAPSTRDAVKDLVQRSGYDGLLVSHYKGTKENYNYVASGPSYYGYGPYFDAWGPYAYGHGYGGSGYVTTTEEHQMETSLFDARGDGKLLWTGTSDTFASGQGQEDIQGYVSTVLGKMASDLH